MRTRTSGLASGDAGVTLEKLSQLRQGWREDGGTGRGMAREHPLLSTHWVQAVHCAVGSSGNKSGLTRDSTKCTAASASQGPRAPCCSPQSFAGVHTDGTVSCKEHTQQASHSVGNVSAGTASCRHAHGPAGSVLSRYYTLQGVHTVDTEPSKECSQQAPYPRECIQQALHPARRVYRRYFPAGIVLCSERMQLVLSPAASVYSRHYRLNGGPGTCGVTR